MKIRLYRGPFNGKVIDHPDAGRTEIFYRGPKPMSREQKWKSQQEWYLSGHGGFGSDYGWRPPTIECRYRIVMINKPAPMRRTWDPNSYGQSFACTPAVCMHPDGSLFYEWVDEAKERRERISNP